MKQTRSPRQILFVPYLDPFIWFYLLVTGRLFGTVICFESKFVPSIGFSRINVAGSKLDEYLDAKRQALDFSELLFEDYSPGIEKNILGHDVDHSIFFKKAATLYCCHLAISAMCLNNRPVCGEALIHPLMVDQKQRQDIAAWFASMSGLSPKTSVFLSRVHPLLNLLLQTVFALGLYLRARFSGERFDRHMQGCIFHNVEAVLQNLDAKEKLSLTALFVDGKLKPSDFIFEIRDPAARAMWQDAGYQVMPDPKKLALAVPASGLLAALFNPLYRCANLVYPVSFIASYELICHLLLQQNQKISGFIYTNSVYEREPVAALASRACGKKSMMLNYSASMFDGAHFAYIHADHVIVWHQLMADFITGHPQAGDLSVSVVGPLMFADDHVLLESSDSDPETITIGIYDVSPKSSEAIENARITTHYTQEFFDAFIGDVVSLKTLDQSIRLKMKQKYKTDEDETIHAAIEQEASDTNPFKSVAGCDIVICMPFTSILYAAEFSGIPSVAYSPHQNLRFNSIPEEHEKVISGRAALHQRIHEMLLRREKTLHGDNVCSNENPDANDLPLNLLRKEIQKVFKRPAEK